MWVANCPAFIPTPTLVWAELFQVEQISEPAGFVSQTEAIESGTTKASLSPTLSSNGYNFGYWEINGVRQAGSDGRSLTTVSSVISQTTTYKAYYFSDSADTDNDGIKDWYEYRVWNLSGAAADDPDRDGYSNKEESELGQDPLVVDEVQWGACQPFIGRFVYADTSMVWPRSRAIRQGLSPSQAITWRAAR